ncbi:hypothetical protein C8F04DRAFT_1190250 [Mycena alexandri]|uniref:Uncharacterized protein n=1 Tax=Mycena alexandri TaxID=1745969 RepID=A0AAD6SGY7_9AGAR|nr:hypothetical protein C8F04DRAFT_1190250 [Mycena alexandri]
MVVKTRLTSKHAGSAKAQHPPIEWRAIFMDLGYVSALLGCAFKAHENHVPGSLPPVSSTPSLLIAVACVTNGVDQQWAFYLKLLATYDPQWREYRGPARRHVALHSRRPFNLVISSLYAASVLIFSSSLPFVRVYFRGAWVIKLPLSFPRHSLPVDAALMLAIFASFANHAGEYGCVFRVIQHFEPTQILGE